MHTVTTTTTVAPNCDNDNDEEWGSSLDREMREELKTYLHLKLLICLFFVFFFFYYTNVCLH
jgi:hypothetical protein